MSRWLAGARTRASLRSICAGSSPQRFIPIVSAMA